jgi:hypothetical protein
MKPKQRILVTLQNTQYPKKTLILKTLQRGSMLLLFPQTDLFTTEPDGSKKGVFQKK